MIQLILNHLAFALACCVASACTVAGPTSLPTTKASNPSSPATQPFDLLLDPSAGVGKLARFGPPGGMVAGPPGRRPFEYHTNARRIVIVVFIRGNWAQAFDSPKEALNKAIVKLRPPQSFDMIFVAGKKPESFVHDKLKQDELALAIADNKRQLSAFLEDGVMSKENDPIPAIELAFSRQPDVVYLLADTEFPDSGAVRKKLTELNKAKQVTVNTIAYSHGDPESEFLEVLGSIAKEGGGRLTLGGNDQDNE